jgi:hypothetical protein
MAATVMGLVIALVLCLVIGLVLDRRLFGAPGCGPVEFLGRGLMLGLGAAGAASMAVDAAGLGVSRGTVGVALLVVLALALVPKWAARPRPHLPLPVTRGPTRWLSVVLLLFAAVTLGLTVHTGLEWPTFQFDALTRWMFKAKVLWADGTLRGAVSTDADFAFTHQRYPPLVSHVANLPALVSGSFDDSVASAMFPWFGVALAAVVGGAVARRSGRLSGSAATAWVASLPLLAYLPSPPPGSGAFSAMADIPLALFATGAVLAAADGLDERRPRAFAEAALLAGFATLTKNEGLPLLLGLMLGVCMFSSRSRLGRALWLGGVAAGLYALLWAHLALRFPALDEHYPGRLNAQALSDGLPRLPVVLGRFGQELFSFPRWNLTWPAALVLLGAGAAVLKQRRGVWLVLLVVAWQLAAYVGAYVVTGWTSPAAERATGGGDPVTYLMEVTLGRLVMHVTPLIIAASLMVAPPADGEGAAPSESAEAGPDADAD